MSGTYTRSGAVLGAVLLACGSTLLLPSSPSVRPEDEPRKVDDAQIQSSPPLAPTGVLSEGAGVTTLLSSLRSESIQINDPAISGLRVIRREQSAPYTKKNWLFTTSYQPISVSGVNGPGELYVLGIEQDAITSIIEHWTIDDGGDFLARPVVVRNQLFRGTAIHEPGAASIAADPDGHFLMILHGQHPRALTRFDLSSKSMTDEVTSTVHPVLAFAHTQYPLQHEVDGRVWCIELGNVNPTFVLVDSQNDGTFESWKHLSVDELKSHGYMQSDLFPGGYKITDDFVREP